MGGISVLMLMSVLLAMFYFMLAILLVVIVYILINYIFESIFIMRIYQHSHRPCFLAWIPFYQKCCLGQIAKLSKAGYVLCINQCIVMLLGCYFYLSQNAHMLIFLIFLLLLLLSFILDMVIAHHIYHQVTPRYGDLLTIFSVFSLGLLRPIFLFFMRHREELIIGENENV